VIVRVIPPSCLELSLSPLSQLNKIRALRNVDGRICTHFECGNNGEIAWYGQTVVVVKQFNYQRTVGTAVINLPYSFNQRVTWLPSLRRGHPSSPATTRAT